MLKCSRKHRQDVFFGRSLGRVMSVSVLPKKCCDQEFTLCFFVSINFHCLILEHGFFGWFVPVVYVQQCLVEMQEDSQIHNRLFIGLD